MAYNDFFGDINNCLGVSPFGIIRRTVPAGAGSDPVNLYVAGGIQVLITLFDVYAIPTAASGTITIETNLNAIGYVAMTNALNTGAIGVIARAALIVAAQATVGPLDAMQANKANDADAAMVHLFFHLV